MNFLLKIADKNKNELIRFLKFKIKMEDLILGKVYEKMIREARIKQKKNKTTRINWKFEILKKTEKTTTRN